VITITLEQALAKGYGTWRSFTCPSHPDTNPSARVNVTTGKWVCMVCHARGDTKGYVPDPIMVLDQAMLLLDQMEDDSDKPESWLDQFDSGPVHPYWLSRFSEPVCRVYRLGWDGTRRNPCYPIRGKAGLPLGIVHRNIHDPEGPKYHYPMGVRTTELIFGVRELTQSRVLFLTEGAADAIAVREAGHDAVATYGARLFDPQVRLIAELEPKVVIIAYDMDKAGHEGTVEARRLLTRAGITSRRALWNARYSDVAKIPLEIRRSTLQKSLASRST
jgi:DNA primase